MIRNRHSKGGFALFAVLLLMISVLFVACGNPANETPDSGQAAESLTEAERPTPTQSPTPTVTPTPSLKEQLLERYVEAGLTKDGSVIQQSSVLKPVWNDGVMEAFAMASISGEGLDFRAKRIDSADVRAYKKQPASLMKEQSLNTGSSDETGESAGLEITNGSCLYYPGIDFGQVGARVFRFCVSAKAETPGVVAVVLDSPDNEPVGFLQLPKDGANANTELATELTTSDAKTVSGIHDVYLVFLGEGYSFHYWYANCESLAELYGEYFPIGVALPDHVIRNKLYHDTINNNFNSITCENEMKADALLNKSKSQAGLPESYLCPAVSFGRCQAAILYALDNGQKLRFHTLVWQNQTTKWLFTEDYTDDGPLVSREVMLQRMENYIRQVLTYFKENYPGLIYAVDVVNEAYNGPSVTVQTTNNRWYDTIGEDYIYYAFLYARRYAADDMKLFYNDYNCLMKTNKLPLNLKPLQDEGLIDGIGMQSHFSVSNHKVEIMLAIKKFCEAGFEVQLTELDIGMENNSPWYMMKQEMLYRDLFHGLVELKQEGYPITSVTLWGLSDSLTWRSGEYPLLFHTDLSPKGAYYAVLEGLKE